VVTLVAELYRMLRFWYKHRFCGIKESKAFGMYMLRCPVHEVGETTGDV
jgi:hypothetical protein